MRFAISIFLLLIPVYTFSQSAWTKGYIIESDSSIVNGEVISNKVGVKFRSNKESREIALGPEDLIAYGFGTEKYVSATLPYIDESRKTDNLPTNKNYQLDNTTAFVRSYFDEALNLYKFVDENGRNHFYISKNGNIDYLVYYRYLDSQNVKEVNGFKSTLSDNMAACPDINSRIVKSRYSEYDLVRLFQYYYECDPELSSAENIRQKGTIKIGLLAGLSLSKMAAFGEFDRESSQVDKFSPSPTFGVSVAYDPFRRSKIATVLFDVQYQQLDANFERLNLQNSNFKTLVTSEVKENSILAFLGIRRQIFEATRPLSLEIGGVFASRLNTQQSRTSVLFRDDTEVSRSTSSGSRQVNDTEIGYFVGMSLPISGRFTLVSRLVRDGRGIDERIPITRINIMGKYLFN